MMNGKIRGIILYHVTAYVAMEMEPLARDLVAIEIKTKRNHALNIIYCPLH